MRYGRTCGVVGRWWVVRGWIVGKGRVFEKNKNNKPAARAHLLERGVDRGDGHRRRRGARGRAAVAIAAPAPGRARLQLRAVPDRAVDRRARKGRGHRAARGAASARRRPAGSAAAARLGGQRLPRLRVDDRRPVAALHRGDRLEPPRGGRVLLRRRAARALARDLLAHRLLHLELLGLVVGELRGRHRGRVERGAARGGGRALPGRALGAVAGRRDARLGEPRGGDLLERRARLHRAVRKDHDARVGRALLADARAQRLERERDRAREGDVLKVGGGWDWWVSVDVGVNGG